jgi:hypothetical protein
MSPIIKTIFITLCSVVVVEGLLYWAYKFFIHNIDPNKKW